MGAYLNVKINASGLNDKAFVEKVLAEGKEIEMKTIEQESKILEIVNSKIEG
jgi:glutamate formiminotransferase/formiminotetrahydrofolate cyclodeaminase